VVKLSKPADGAITAKEVWFSPRLKNQAAAPFSCSLLHHPLQSGGGLRELFAEPFRLPPAGWVVGGRGTGGERRR
jgi:hypothetical protein